MTSVRVFGSTRLYPAHRSGGAVLVSLLAVAAVAAETTPRTRPVEPSRSSHETFLDEHGSTVHRELVPHPDDADRQIEFFWIAPEGDGPWPVILYVHPHQLSERKGGRSYVEAPVLRRHAARGRLAAAISQPGYGESSGPPDFCGPSTQRAVEEVIRRLRAHPEGDGRVVLYGYSRGAAVSAMVATRDPELTGVVLGAGSYDLIDFFARLEPTSEPGSLRDNIVRESGASEAAFRARSALHAPEPIRSPTLILHGEDDFIPVDHARRLAARLEAAGTPVDLRLFPGVGHHIPFPERNRPLAEFLGRLLADDATSDASH